MFFYNSLYNLSIMKKTLILCLFLTVTSCSNNNIKAHGNIISQDDLKHIEIGQTSKNDLIMMLGQPTTKSSLDKDTWYYMGQTIKLKSFMKPDLLSRKIVEFQFDEEGNVLSISEYDEKDAKNIKISPDKTESLATKQSPVQQFIGNIGKFNQKGMPTN